MTVRNTVRTSSRAKEHPSGAVDLPPPLISPVFILGSHKSGSSLLRSLLDGHPALAVLPTEEHYFQYSHYWVDYALRRSWPRCLPTEDWKEAVVQQFAEQNNRGGQFSASPGFHGHDVDALREGLRRWSAVDEPARFRAYMNAVHYSLGASPVPDGKRIVEKSVENAEFASHLRQFCADCKFIHIVRNPYATMVAIRRSRSRKRYPLLRETVESLYNSYYWLWRNFYLLDGYLTVRYEDLITSTPAVMNRIAQFLDIGYSELLLEPTLLGKSWCGNSTSGQSFSGVAQEPAYNWRCEITPLEIELVNRIAQPIIEAFGYDVLERRRSTWRRAPGEGIGNYLLNRMLLVAGGVCRE